MPTAAEQSRRVSATIAGHSIELEQPYEAGQLLGAAEAAKLNKLRFELSRQAAARRIAKSPELSREELQAFVDSYDWLAASAKWQPPADPTGQEAKRIATSAARATLARKGQTPEDLGPERFAAVVAEIARSELVQYEARRRVLATQSSAKQLLGEAGAEFSL